MTVNNEILELVLKYPELIDELSPGYRKELFVLYYRNNPIENVPQYMKIADAYNKAGLFKVSAISQAIQEIFDLKKDNANMHITYAKRKGLIPKSVKTTHGRGYRQKNYQGIVK